ncbi:MAG: ATP-binding cassette domain-containing protein [Sorangiineae bacterium]|nr:ATP-binding cassette domain-containing protein [Polyangiaceae bacterium]MEB2321793.1 ATP-binding cassette domain-containing protein [Sorangiineae bacterium]
MGAALEVEEVEKRFGGTLALDRVTLAVRSGSVFGLLGPNGAGKSTLIRIVMDILRADRGRVLVNGVPSSTARRERLGYLPEERGLYRRERASEVLEYLAMLKGLSRREARERARVWLERMGLGFAAKYRVERLSKGMSQKLQLAATLLPEPGLCVLDEPFSGLDPVNVRLVRELIHERRARGLTTILSTHQLREVEDLCDDVALVHRGRVLLAGETGEIRRRHSRREVELVTEDGRAPALEGVEVHRRDDGSFIVIDTRARRPAELLRALVGSGVELERFAPVLASLEEIFVRAVSEETGS